MKGAPDRLLDRSATELALDGARPLRREWWEREVEALDSEGLRVLAAARRPGLEPDDELTLDDLVELEFLGLVGIVDPRRSKRSMRAGRPGSR